jgi:hypothetical protein
LVIGGELVSDGLLLMAIVCLVGALFLLRLED